MTQVTIKQCTGDRRKRVVIAKVDGQWTKGGARMRPLPSSVSSRWGAAPAGRDGRGGPSLTTAPSWQCLRFSSTSMLGGTMIMTTALSSRMETEGIGGGDALDDRGTRQWTMTPVMATKGKR
jgi:hypothetical protein